MKLQQLFESDRTLTITDQTVGFLEQLIAFIADPEKTDIGLIRFRSAMAPAGAAIRTIVAIKAIRNLCRQVSALQGTDEYEVRVDDAVDEAQERIQKIKDLFPDATHQFLYGTKTPGYINMLLRKTVEKMSSTSIDTASKIYAKGEISAYQVGYQVGWTHTPVDFAAVHALATTLNMHQHAPHLNELIAHLAATPPAMPPNRLVIFKCTNSFMLVTLTNDSARHYFFRSEENPKGEVIVAAYTNSRDAENGAIELSMGEDFAQHTDALVNAIENIFVDDKYLPALEFV